LQNRLFNDVVAALNATFAHGDAAPQPLPDELTRILSQYVAKARKEGDGLHDELRTIFAQHVEGNANKLPAFISMLKVLRPAIASEDRLAVWHQSCRHVRCPRLCPRLALLRQ
jgi:hypothetical protein